MKIGLFIPCYVNQFYPKVAMATYGLLKHLGLEVDYPLAQTCCGQPLANSGYERFTIRAIEHFIEIFHIYDRIVAPSGSCVLFVREHPSLDQGIRERIFELTEFIIDHGFDRQLSGSFTGKVGILQSCHGLRGLGLGKPSELIGEDDSKVHTLLSRISGIELVIPERPDECCGFGGTFSVKEADVSVKMGMDRLEDFLAQGAEVVTGTDMSCLMHLDGLIRKKRIPLEVKHLSEILYQS